MKIKAFLHTYKQITYTILLCYLTMSISQSYAMDNSDFDLNEINAQKKVIVSQEKGTPLTGIKTTDISPRSVVNNNQAFTFQNVPDTDAPIELEGNGSYRPVPFDGEDDNAAKEKAVKTERTNIFKSKEESNNFFSYENQHFYLKSLTSFAISLLAVLGLAYFAYDLGGDYNKSIARTLFIDSLLASAILYHRSNMGLSINDFKLNLDGSWMGSTQSIASSLFKLSIAIISSGALSYVTYFRVKGGTGSQVVAAASCMSSFACVIPLYFKAQTSLLDYCKYRYKLANIKNDKEDDARFYHYIGEELPALSRDEIHAVSEKYASIKMKHKNKKIPDDEFKNLMRLVVPKENNTSERFWVKECAGGAFGVFSAVFGGMYLFLVSDPIYRVMVQDNSLGLSPTSINALTLACALSISIGQNSLQTKSAYDVSKFYTTKFIRAYESLIAENPLLYTRDEESGVMISTKRDISVYQEFLEQVLDFSKIILAGGAAAARSQIAINYVQNPVLLVYVLMGANTSFATTFHAAIHSQLESVTETGKQLAEVIAVVSAKKKECLDSI